jgi:diguanylate cyclase (GGDEF)-like protein/PAS domain S-box-containing protein
MNDQARIHVLLVEDGQIDARLLRGALAPVQDAEFTVTHVDTLAKAQTRLAAESFDIVLLDLGLPDCRGIEAFHRVHRLRPDVPVIVLTEADEKSLALDAMRAGALDHLLKHQIQIPGLGRALRYAVKRYGVSATRSESTFRLTDILDSAMDAMISVDEQQRVVLFNLAAEKMFGYSVNDVLGQSLDRMIPSRYRSAHAGHMTGFARANTTHRKAGELGVVYGLRADDTEFPIEASISQVEMDGRKLLSVILRDTSERNRTEEGLRKKQEVFRQLAAIGADYFWELDAQLRFTAISPEIGVGSDLDYKNYIGKTRWELPFIGVSGAQWDEHRSTLEAHKPFRDFVGALRNLDGKERWFQISGDPLFDQDGTFTGYRGVTRDITDRKARELKIARLTRIRAVLSAINGAIVRLHGRDALFAETCRIAVVEGAFKMAWIGEFDPVTLDGRVVASYGIDQKYIDLIRFSGSPDAPSRERPASRAFREMKPVVCNNLSIDLADSPTRTELLVRGHQALAIFPLVVDGRVAAVLSLHAAELGFFDDEEVNLLNELANDVAFGLDYIAKAAKLDYLAYYDVLTGLPNSTLFHDRLAQSLSLAAHNDRTVALYLIDLDRFTQVNDTLGRHAGDTLLKLVAERFNRALPKASSLARISADTFAIAVADLSNSADSALAHLQNYIFASLSREFMVDGNELRVSARAGIALFPEDGNDADTLFKNAEAALTRVKASAASYLFYAPEMNARMAEKVVFENQLRVALEIGQFVLHYQPIVELSSGQIVGAEALIRWQHPEKGLLLPARFLPIVEESGLSIPLGEWVLRTACAQIKTWHDAGLPQVTVSVNVSARQFRDEALVQNVADALERTGLEARWLELELTEDIVMQDTERLITKLNTLKALGVRLSLDDFGTGYSSLSYLKRFPLDQLKVDQSFVRDVTSNPNDAAIVRAVISLGNSMKLELVVEGVETATQLAWLRRHRCEKIQGYYFSPPLSASEFEQILRDRKSLPPEAGSASVEAKTLLIVDDESNIVAAVVRLLHREGYRILTAHSAKQAFEVLALNDVQVVLSDHRMPVMTGAEFLGRVKGLYPDTVRILFSGYVEMEALTDAVNRGAVFRLLLKPWDDKVLRESIRDAFNYYWLTHRQEPNSADDRAPITPGASRTTTEANNER